MYGGDEVSALVVDVGSDTVKAGYAGEDNPKHVFPTALGCLAGEGGDATVRKWTVDDLNNALPGLDVSSVFTDGLISNWEGMEQIWTYTLRTRLRAETVEMPLMVSEPPHVRPEQREKLVQLLFEKFQPPALFIAKTNVLSSFAVGRPTSLVIDCGASGTVVSAVHDGYSLGKSVIRTPVGGAALSEATLNVVLSSGVDVRPRFQFKRTTKDGSIHIEPNPRVAGVTASFTRHKQLEIAADIKESCFRVYDNAFSDADVANMPSTPYELPDGRTLELGIERFKVPELLFNPGLLTSMPTPMSGDTSIGTLADLANSAASLKGIPAAVADVVNRCDIDIRRELYGGIVLTGGGSLFTGLKERLERDITASAPAAVKVKLMASTSTQERRFGTWLGGSILSSLGTFQQLWMSKREYEEHGAALVHKKCP